MSRAPGAVRLLVADDHPIMRSGLVAILEDEANLKIVAEASNGAEAVARYREHVPDVVLLDLRMPDMDGVDVTRAIRAITPDARIIILTTFDIDEGIYEAVRAGARAYLLKDASPDELIACIHAVHAGETRLSPAQAARLAARISSPELTARELEVLQLAATGASNKQIANKLLISDVTVKTHLGHVFAKLGVATRTEAIAEATRRGVVRR